MSDVEVYPSEQWRPVIGWEGAYEVSDAGRVRSIDRVVHRSDGVISLIRGKLLKPCAMPGGRGHLFVNLSAPGVGARLESVHRLVLIAFVGQAPDGMECCHNDGDPTNNQLANLRWDTRSENMRDRFRHGWVVTGPTLARIKRNGPNRCSKGHEMTPDNCRPNGRWFPRCKKCHVLEQRAYLERKRSSQKSTTLGVRATLWLMAAGGLIGYAVVGSVPAHADPGSIEPQVARYALTAAPSMCLVLDEYPTLPGVEGVLQGIHNDSGFTAYQSGEALALGVQTQCPRHLPLLERFARTFIGGDTTTTGGVV